MFSLRTASVQSHLSKTIIISDKPDRENFKIFGKFDWLKFIYLLQCLNNTLIIKLGNSSTDIAQSEKISSVWF